jgi:hypothetical protein
MREYPQAIARDAVLVQHYLDQIRDGATALLEQPCPSYRRFRARALRISVLADKLYALVAPVNPEDPDAPVDQQREEGPMHATPLPTPPRPPPPAPPRPPQPGT